jgi:hypothetical protein
MGLYDCRCMVTGVSLKASDAALVLLQQKGKTYHPIALAIQGTYNRLGSIDNIDEDENTELIWNYFEAKSHGDEFVTETRYLEICECWPMKGIEDLLTCFERNINDHKKAAVLHGQPVVFALICQTIWKSLARSPVAKKSATQLFAHLFADVPAATEIYRDNLTEVSTQLKELSAVSDFLTSRKLAWKPADNPGQDYAEEMRQYLAEARETFRDSAVVLDALKHYESEVSEMLTDDED